MGQLAKRWGGARENVLEGEGEGGAWKIGMIGVGNNNNNNNIYLKSNIHKSSID